MRIIVRSGAAAGQEFEITHTMTVGRAAGCDVRLPDAGVSSNHARVRPAEGGVEVVDLGSLNGTSVGGQALSGPRVVYPGATVRFSRVECEVAASVSVRMPAPQAPIYSVPAPAPQPVFMAAQAGVAPAAPRQGSSTMLGAVAIAAVASAVFGLWAIFGGNGSAQASPATPTPIVTTAPTQATATPTPPKPPPPTETIPPAPPTKAPPTTTPPPTTTTTPSAVTTIIKKLREGTGPAIQGLPAAKVSAQENGGIPGLFGGAAYSYGNNTSITIMFFENGDKGVEFVGALLSQVPGGGQLRDLPSPNGAVCVDGKGVTRCAWVNDAGTTILASAPTPSGANPLVPAGLAYLKQVIDSK